MLTREDQRLTDRFREVVKASGLSPEAFWDHYAGEGDPSASTVRRWLDPGDTPSRMTGDVRRFFGRIVQELSAGDAADAPPAADPRDDLYQELAKILRESGGDLHAVQAALLDLAIMFRADAIRRQGILAGRRTEARQNEVGKVGSEALGETHPEPTDGPVSKPDTDPDD